MHTYNKNDVNIFIIQVANRIRRIVRWWLPINYDLDNSIKRI